MFWLIVVIGLLADQVTKYMISTGMQISQSIPVIPNIFHLTYIMNKGAAYSILQGQRWFFIVIAAAVVVGVLIFLTKVPKKDLFLRTALALIISGAIGNMIDRIRFGGVVDFIDFRVFPIFNIADSLVVIGVCLLVLYVFCAKPSTRDKIKI